MRNKVDNNNRGQRGQSRGNRRKESKKKKKKKTTKTTKTQQKRWTMTKMDDGAVEGKQRKKNAHKNTESEDTISMAVLCV